MKKNLLLLLMIAAVFSSCKKDSLVGKSMTVNHSGTAATIAETNIFTPNGDGKNDFFTGPILAYPFTDSVSGTTMKIFSGSTQISSSNRWDGVGQADGIYHYETNFIMIQGGSIICNGYVRLWRNGSVSCDEKSLFYFPQAFRSDLTYNPNSNFNENIPCN